jgi:prophage antirepressor-like protein
MDMIVADLPQENVIAVSNEPDNILVEQFQQFNIEIYGTFQEPLFKAKDIGDLLEIKNVRRTIENLDDDCKIKLNVTNSYAGFSDTWFLTEDGLYELLFISRKPLAKEFKKWVRTLIKEIRLNTNNSLETRIKELEYFKEQSYEEMPMEEFNYCNSTDIPGIFKIGKSIDIKQRKDGSQTPCVMDIKTLYQVKTVDGYVLEKIIHLTLNKYRVSKREHFRCNLDHIKLVMDKCAKFVNTMACIRQSITHQELTEKLQMNIPIPEFIPVTLENNEDSKITKKLNSIQEQLNKVVKKKQRRVNYKPLVQEVTHELQDIDLDELFPPPPPT